MIPSSEPSHRTIDMEAPSWCWSHLGTGGEGILSYETSRGRRSLAVPYAVSGRQITIPLGWFNQTGWRAAGSDTRLEVSGRTPDDLRWVVRATGTAERMDSSDQSGLGQPLRIHPANGIGSGAAQPPNQLSLKTPRMRGFCETTLSV